MIFCPGQRLSRSNSSLGKAGISLINSAGTSWGRGACRAANPARKSRGKPAAMIRMS